MDIDDAFERFGLCLGGGCEKSAEQKDCDGKPVHLSLSAGMGFQFLSVSGLHRTGIVLWPVPEGNKKARSSAMSSGASKNPLDN